MDNNKRKQKPIKYHPGKCANRWCHAEFVGSRGLCYKCYRRASMQVENKLTTWEQMEKLGQIPPIAAQYKAAVAKRRRRRLP